MLFPAGAIGAREPDWTPGPRQRIAASRHCCALLAIEVNLSLFFFNLLPIPPLDGSRVVRNMLPYNAVQQYDRIGGWISWVLMIVVGGFILRLLVGPSIGLIFSVPDLESFEQRTPSRSPPATME